MDTWGLRPRQPGQAWDFPTCLVPGGRGGENPKLTCWHGVLVDLAWGTLIEWARNLSMQRSEVPDQHTCLELGTLVYK